MKMVRCIFVVFLLVGALLPTSGETAETAVSKYNRAVRFYEAGGMNNTKQAFMLLWDAWCATSDRNMKKNIESMLQRVYNQHCEEVRKHVYLPNDNKWGEGDEDFYDKLISYGKNARAYRLKGLILIRRNKFDEALSCLAKADNGGDSEAAFWIARCYAKGWGCKKNPKLAFQWLERGVSLGSPSCNYWMGEVLWGCNSMFGGPTNRCEDALQYLEEALRYVKRWTLGDAQEEKERTRRVREMERAIGYLRDYKHPFSFEERVGIKDFMPSLFALELDNWEEKFLHRVYKLLVEHGIYLTPPGTHVEVDHIKLVPASTHPNYLGLATRRYPDNRTVMNKITIFLDKLPTSGNTSRQYWWRFMVYCDTLVHEMAHVFFSQRYVAIPEFGSDLNCKRTYEGHATNAAYMFMNNEFFRNKLTPERYAEMFLSNEYKKYFFWFRNECMSPGEDVYWGKIDKWEREAARELGYKDTEVITRKQVPWKE